VDVAIEHQLAHLQRRQVLQDHHLAAERLEPFVDRAAAGQSGEFRSQDRLVGGLERGVPIEELDHVVALVHAVLDQRITSKRADHVDAGDSGLERRGQLGIGHAVGAGELDAGAGLDRLAAVALLELGANPLDERARRRRAHPCDDAIAARLGLPVASLEGNLARVDRRRGRLDQHGHPARGLCRAQGLDVGILGGGEFGRAVDQCDGIGLLRIGREAERVFDAGVAAADHDDMLVDIFAGIVELVLHHRAFTDRAAHQVGVALGANGQDHGFSLKRFTVLEADDERALLAGDPRHFRIGADANLAFGDLAIPRVEDRFALAGIEIEIAAQHQVAGRRHHVLALLVLEDGIGEVVGLFDQHVAHAERGGVRGGAEPRRTRADDRHANLV
jgi:hypothetical protein